MFSLNFLDTIAVLECFLLPLAMYLHRLYNRPKTIPIHEIPPEIGKLVFDKMNMNDKLTLYDSEALPEHFRAELYMSLLHHKLLLGKDEEIHASYINVDKDNAIVGLDFDSHIHRTKIIEYPFSLFCPNLSGLSFKVKRITVHHNGSKNFIGAFRNHIAYLEINILHVICPVDKKIIDILQDCKITDKLIVTMESSEFLYKLPCTKTLILKDVKCWGNDIFKYKGLNITMIGCKFDEQEIHRFLKLVYSTPSIINHRQELVIHSPISHELKAVFIKFMRNQLGYKSEEYHSIVGSMEFSRPLPDNPRSLNITVQMPSEKILVVNRYG